MKGSILVVKLAVATTGMVLVLVGTMGLLDAEPSVCHGTYAIKFNGPSSPPEYTSMWCEGDCEDPNQGCYGQMLLGPGAGRQWCACSTDPGCAPEPTDVCHMVEDLIEVGPGVYAVTGRAYCTPHDACPPAKPLCWTKYDEANEDGWQRAWCECLGL